MSILELINYGKKYVSEDKVIMLLSSLLNVSLLDIKFMYNKNVNKKIEDIFKSKIMQINNNIPIQYVIGNVDFFGNKFIVNPNVLIPRFETEELVENTIMYIKKYFNYPVRILDMGCGSGAIGLTLKDKLPMSNVSLLDISKEALKVSKENAKQLNLDVSFIESNMWENVNEKYDVIISNPPYIRNDEVIEDIVKNNEPNIALYGGIDGLDFYRIIRKECLNHVNNKFLIALEIGDMQKEDVVNLFSDIPGVIIETKKDLQKRDRMVFIIKSE